ncbi:MAG: HAD family phosphatase [Candidatus Bathyarchaeota archaeon]|jgi:HAD superfamily hydrolase (TIGR01509 family)
MFEAVIFDWDGTLADTRDAVVMSFQKTLEQIGCRVSDEFIELRIGIGAKNTFKEALKKAHAPFNDSILEKLVEKKSQWQINLSENVKLFEGAVNLLDCLHGKVKIALASMNNKKVIRNLVVEKDVKKYFNVIMTVEDIKHPKPDPEIFLKSSTNLGCPPKKCVVVEDSIFGVEVARKAGMKCIAVSTGAYSKQELKEADSDLIVNSINEKQKILSFVFQKHT